MKHKTKIVIALLVVVAIGSFMAVGCNTKTGGGSAGPGGPPKPTDPWPRTVADLARSPDAMTARRSLNNLNSDLLTLDQLPPTFAPEAMKAAAALVRPGPDEQRDWQQADYTGMDANHLAESLFFDSVADSLNIRDTPLNTQAVAAFDWVCRQVYYRPWSIQQEMQLLLLPTVPPQYVLQRGYGLGWDREMVYLALARQIGFDAYLIGEPGMEQKPRIANRGKLDDRGPFWAVGVRDGDDVLLFDPWIGSPIPAVDGKGILKLSAAKANPKTVTEWHAAQKARQPVTADTIAKSCCYSSAPVNAFPPRIKLLEEKLAAESGVKLSVDPAAVATRGAKLPGGPPRWYGPPVTVDPYAIPHVLGSFLPQKIEGGYDTTPPGREQVFAVLANYDLIYGGLFAFPDPGSKRPGPLPELQEESAQREFRGRCLGSYHQTVLDSTSRDRIQRGQFNEAIRQLQEIDRSFATQRERQRDPGVPKLIAEWCAAANSAYAKLRIAKVPGREAEQPEAELAVAKLWDNNPGAGMAVQSVAMPLTSSEIAYRIALLKHEQAARAQIRHRRAAAENRDAARATALTAWAGAQDEWHRYQETAPRFESSFPGRAAHAAALAAKTGQYLANPDQD